MSRITYTREQVQAAYNELKRRIDGDVFEYPDLHDGRDMPQDVYFDLCYDMTQGLYSAFMATAANWPEICQWIPEEETKRCMRRE